MKLALLSLTLLTLATLGSAHVGSLRRRTEKMHRAAPVQRQLAELEAFPMQTFFIPLPEESMFNDMFVEINENRAEGPVESMLSVAISTDKTVIWFDHHEDSYEVDITNATSSTTTVWGDESAANGCAPNVDPCTDEADKLNAGDTIVIQNTVAIPRDSNITLFDGGDRMQASYPIAVTRGAYPNKPGSLMAGAVEVLDTELWGTTFEAPVGQDVGETFVAFQYTALFFMAAFDNTQVTLPDSTVMTLDRGQSSMIRVNQGDTLTSDKIIQVDLITGDTWSYYELRWYSLLDVNVWSKEYVSPVGDSVGKTKMVLYNPGSEPLDITVEYLDESNQTKTTEIVTVQAGKHALSPVIPTDSGAFVKSSNKFIALSLTDSEDTTSLGQITESQWYDWGFPVVPRDELTPQVLIGWGYGCTDNNCYGYEDRSVVWVTPVSDTDIYVDYDNTGGNYSVFPRKALTSTRFTDTDDTDMSGAIIFATEPDSGPEGPPVDIAAAWGQDPKVSRPHQQISLDLGTVVLPFANVRVNKVVDKETVHPGEVLTYTIRITNVGQKIVRGGSLRILDELDGHVTYVADSASFTVQGGVVTAIADNDDVETAGRRTKFPLDEDGFLVPADLERRGGVLDIMFQVIVDDVNALGTAQVIVNTGHVKQQLGSLIPFQATSTVDYKPSVRIDNRAYLGDDFGGGCLSTDKPVDIVQGELGDAVVYCFNVTNNGFSYLDSFIVDNIELSFSDRSIRMLEPGASAMLTMSGNIAGNLTNHAIVLAVPVFSDGAPIPDQYDVTATDPSTVTEITLIDSDVKNGVKPPYSPPNPKVSPNSCLQDSWKDAGNDDDLSCTNEQVYLDSITSAPMSCNIGETITVSVINASIHIDHSLYDFGWYIATDNGDALEGTCVLNGLQESYEYKVVQGPGSTNQVGEVSWTNDSNGGDDQCGDVFIPGEDSANIEIPFVVETTLVCADNNDDGSLDLSVCFSWRLENSDEYCTLEDASQDTVGSLSDLFPGSPTMCHCETYDVPTIHVTPRSGDVVKPC